jgi:hypothetical protein
MTVPPFAFEIKRCQGISKRNWWLQISTAVKEWKERYDEKRIPIVAYRKNGQPWRFLISAREVGLEVGFIQLEEIEAKKWLKNKLK